MVRAQFFEKPYVIPLGHVGRGAAHVFPQTSSLLTALIVQPIFHIPTINHYARSIEVGARWVGGKKTCSYRLVINTSSSGGQLLAAGVLSRRL